jgi:hypothetical protein
VNMALRVNKLQFRERKSMGLTVNKKLNFNFSELEENQVEDIANMSDNFSPCRTRSGIVYEP